MTSYWFDTPFAEFAENVMQCPTHRLAYFMGQIDQTVHELFGVTPDSDDAPSEAREVALLMMRALSGEFAKDKLDLATAEAARIVKAWQARRTVN